MREVMHQIVYYPHMIVGINTSEFDPIPNKYLVERRDDTQTQRYAEKQANHDASY
jgi:hypothetical protein